MPPRRRRKRRINRKLLIWIGGGVAAALLLPVIVVLGLIATIDPNSYKAQLEGSLRQVLGRDLRIRGQLSVSASLSPKLEADDVTIANMPTGSRADMVRIERMTIELAPRALLTGELVISRIALQRPDVLIETDAQGLGNWRNAALVDGEARKPEAAAGEGPLLALQTVHLRDGRLTWRDGATGKATVFEFRRLSATSAAPGAPVAISAEILTGRQRIVMAAQTGPLARFAEATAKTPWGVFLNLESDGAKLTIAGALTRPYETRGYSLRVDGAIPNLNKVAWLTDWRLPPLSNVTFSARLLDTGGDYPDVSAVTMQVGFTNLDKVAAGFTLDSVRIEMPRMSEPIAIEARGTYGSAPFSVSGNLGAPALLMPFAPPGQPYVVDLKMEAAGASIAMRGAIAEPSKRMGMDVAIGARVPDLAQLGAIAGQRLPALRNLAFSARIVDGEGGYMQEVALKNLVLTVPQADVSGDIAVAFGERPRVRATVKSSAIDVDALLAVWEAARRADETTQQRTGRTRRVDATAPAPLPVGRPGDSMISDERLPFDLLAMANADVRLAIGSLRVGGVSYRDLTGSAVLSDGRLVINPLAGEVAGGRTEMRLAIDGRTAATGVGLIVKANGVELKGVLPSIGLPERTVGKLDLDAELQSSGGSLHELAAGMTGRLALAVIDGEVDNEVFGVLMPEVLRVLRQGVDRAEAPRVRLRCMSTRAAIVAGVATLEQAAFDSARLSASAAGKIDLGRETYALQLRPALRVVGTGAVVPMRAEGGWTEPKLVPDPGSVARPAGTNDACIPSLAGIPPAARRVQ